VGGFFVDAAMRAGRDQSMDSLDMPCVTMYLYA